MRLSKDLTERVKKKNNKNIDDVFVSCLWHKKKNINFIMSIGTVKYQNEKKPLKNIDTLSSIVLEYLSIVKCILCFQVRL